VPQLLLVAASANAALVFGLQLALGRPGLGIGQGFYVSVVLAALATGPLLGATAGAAALVLSVAGLLGHGTLAWSGVVAWPTGIRLVSYVAAGAIVGYVAARGRRLLAESLAHLESLLVLATRYAEEAAAPERDAGALSSRREGSRPPAAEPLRAR